MPRVGLTCVVVVALSGRRSNPAYRGSTGDREVPLEAREAQAKSPKRRLRRLAEQQVDELVAARLTGEQILDLAKRFGVGRSTVQRHLAQKGVPHQRYLGRTLSPAQLEQAGALYASGVRLLHVAEAFDVDRRYLSQALRYAGFAIRSRGQRKRT